MTLRQILFFEIFTCVSVAPNLRRILRPIISLGFSCFFLKN
eukprot:UN21291